MDPAIPWRGDSPVLSADEAWRCDACEHLIYNVDAKGYPAAGAPMPKFWSISKSKVCTACYEMAMALHNRPGQYWEKLHNDWRLEEARLKDAKDRQTGKRDYFTGA